MGDIKDQWVIRAGDIGEIERERELFPEKSEPGKIRELPRREEVPDPAPVTEPKVPVPA